MTANFGLMLGALLLCLVLSAFFSAAETAFATVNRIRLKAMAGEGNEKAALVLRLLDDYDRLLTTLLIGNNIVNLTAATLGTLIFTQLLGGGYGPTVSTIVLTLVVLIFGEVTPKTLATESPEVFAFASARVLRTLITVFMPLNAFFVLWRKLLSKVFKPREVESHIEAELMTMVDEAQSEGDMDAHEGELIRSAIEFNDMDAIDILTPRVDITALEDTATMDEAASLFRESGYSRLPVFREDMDHIVGILHEKDFYVRQHEGIKDIHKIMKPAVYAPATLKISKLLKLFQGSKTHMVILLDEFGGTEGLVTLEDVLEELVGDIYDEHDDVEVDIRSLEDGSWLVDGGMHLAELMERLDVEDTYDADTVGGWATEVLGYIPKTGETFDIDCLHCQVTAMDKRRVTQLRIWKKEQPAQAAAT